MSSIVGTMSSILQRLSALCCFSDDLLTNLAELPDEVIYLILLNLPVKSLIRLCSISKRWQATITSSSFAKQHMKSLRAAAASCKVIHSLESASDTVHEHEYLSFSISSIKYGRQIITPVNIEFGLDRHLLCNNATKKVWYQSCDGLLCFALLDINCYHRITDILICNPATGKQKKFKWPYNMYDYGPYSLNSFLGFGYDASVDDYKIVVLEQFASTMRAQVMSLKEQTWSDVNLKFAEQSWNWVYGFWLGDQWTAVSVNGAVYWIVFLYGQYEPFGRSYRLLRFNFAEESLSLQPLPEGTRKKEKKCDLVSLKGSLFLFTSDVCKYASEVDLWKLQGGTTWSKVCVIPTTNLYPIGLDMSGHVIMVNWFDNSLFVYIPEKSRFVKLHDATVKPACRHRLSCFHFVHLETLVSP